MVRSVEEVKIRYAGLVGRLREKEERVIELRQRVEEGEKKSEVLQGASNLLLELAIEHQAEVIKFLDRIVTKGLQDIFGDHVSVEFREVTRSNQRAIDIVLLIDGVEADIPEGVGGGVVEVVALLVELAVLYSKRGELRQVLFLDEALSHLAEHYVPTAARVLRQISEELGIQIILVTHQEQLAEAADVTYQFTYHRDGTKIERQ